jgi:hypothetical protein
MFDGKPEDLPNVSFADIKPVTAGKVDQAFSIRSSAAHTASLWIFAGAVL